MGNLAMDTIDVLNTGAAVTIKIMDELIELLSSSIERNAEKKMFSVISEYVKNGGEAVVYTPKDFAIKDIEAKMKEKNINYSFGRSRETGAPVIIVRKCDQGLMHDIQTELYVEQRRITRLSPQEFYNLHKGSPTYSVDNLDAHQVYAFQEIAKKANFAFTAVKNETDDKYAVYVGENDVEKVSKALLSMSIKSSGISGRINSGMYLSAKDAIDTAYEMLSSDNRNFYVVSGVKPDAHLEYMAINEEGFTRVSGTREIEHNIERESNDFYSETYFRLNEIIDPVILTPEEFALGEPDRSNLIAQKLGRPQLNAEQIELYEIEEKTTSLLNEYLENAQDGKINVAEVLEKFETEREKENALEFIKDIVEQKSHFELQFVKDIEAEIQVEEDIEQRFDTRMPDSQDLAHSRTSQDPTQLK